jgi:hypothetical protein
MTGRRLVLIATVLFGIVPATFTLLANALYYVQGFMAIPQGVAVDVIWGEVVMLCVAGLAGVAGYVALFYAARGRTTGRVVLALLLGVAAMVYAIVLGLTPYWLGTPVLVGLAHAIGWYLRPRG